ncbi:MAG: glycogen debranching enzyme N-terminal domain-containing protein [Myxococcaceae bacterium]|nr:glycogen debranching enzyme N-terminal domain-containing protein [Myxococcaceae bacterium]
MNELPRVWWQPKEALGREARALQAEWLATNGQGGYASGTVAQCNTRKYHGLFVPSLHGYGRTVLVGPLDEDVQVNDTVYRLSGSEEADGTLRLPGLAMLKQFSMRGLMPEWEFTAGPVTLRKTLVFVHNESSVYVVYQQLSGPPAQLLVRPYLLFRPHHGPPQETIQQPSVHLHAQGVGVQVGPEAPLLRLTAYGEKVFPFVIKAHAVALHYRTEAARGYPCTETVHSPGYFECSLGPNSEVVFCASLNDWETLPRPAMNLLRWEEERELHLLGLCHPAAQNGVAAQLALAADQFLIAPKHRVLDTAWSHATGRELRSVVAGYHWFTDWGRDTMISLEGLTLCTGRAREAAAILTTFLHHVKDGLVPNFFPEGEHEGVYHTADATLWLFHAFDRYLTATQHLQLLTEAWPTLLEIVRKHSEGTRFGIAVDPNDGLLRQGQHGYALTWMDAKVDDWVVTPRRGKAVEINALWFNTLKLMESWAPLMNASAAPFAEAAEKARASFNARFWNEKTQCLFDVIDGESGDSSAIRPNQVFAISLKHSVLSPERWRPVLEVVRRELLTPMGLRTLAPNDIDFKATYYGDLRTRDAAYHQGTVWPWLLGHYLDGWLKLSPELHEVNAMFESITTRLDEAGLGTIGEIYDATAPFEPRGCIAQAWSVAELLRAWLRLHRHGEAGR